MIRKAIVATLCTLLAAVTPVKTSAHAVERDKFGRVVALSCEGYFHSKINYAKDGKKEVPSRVRTEVTKNDNYYPKCASKGPKELDLSFDPKKGFVLKVFYNNDCGCFKEYKRPEKHTFSPSYFTSDNFDKMSRMILEDLMVKHPRVFESFCTLNADANERYEGTRILCERYRSGILNKCKAAD